MQLQEITYTHNSPVKKGPRERNQRERQEHIRLVARKLFAEHGYDATTLRQIAECSGMSPSTLFRYVEDKRDLIYLAFNKDLARVTDACLAAPKPEQSFFEKILSMMEPRYRFFDRETNLSRTLLSETLQPEAGLHYAEHLNNHERFVKGLQAVVLGAQRSGELPMMEDAESITRLIVSVHFGALRWWLASSQYPEWKCGLRDFAVHMRLLISGVAL